MRRAAAVIALTLTTLAITTPADARHRERVVATSTISACYNLLGGVDHYVYQDWFGQIRVGCVIPIRH